MAYAWSRRPITNSLGDSGLPVAQAGQASWQRPHSVQEVRSSRPFQVKSSIDPVPRTASSSRASRSSKSTGSPPARTGSRAPRAGAPSALRLNQTFGHTVNRCQATPIVVSRPSTTNQAMEMTILAAAISTTAVSAVDVARPDGSRNHVSGKSQRVVPAASSCDSSARSARTQTTIPRMVSST